MARAVCTAVTDDDDDDSAYCLVYNITRYGPRYTYGQAYDQGVKPRRYVSHSQMSHGSFNKTPRHVFQRIQNAHVYIFIDTFIVPPSYIVVNNLRISVRVLMRTKRRRTLSITYGVVVKRTRAVPPGSWILVETRRKHRSSGDERTRGDTDIIQVFCARFNTEKNDNDEPRTT